MLGPPARMTYKLPRKWQSLEVAIEGREALHAPFDASLCPRRSKFNNPKRPQLKAWPGHKL